MRYLPRMSVEAVQFDGKNADEIEAACRLADARFVPPGPGGARSGLAIMNSKRGTYDYCDPGDWVVVSEGWARVMKTEAFVKEFVAEGQVTR